MFYLSDHLILNNLKVLDNTVLNGFSGGLYVFYSDFAYITNIVTTGNKAAQFGGGVLIDQSKYPYAFEIYAAYNTAGQYGGGMGIWFCSDIQITNIQVIGNYAGIAAGGILLFTNTQTNVVKNIKANNNTAISYAAGVGAANMLNLQMSDISAYGNSVTRGFGGGLYLASLGLFQIKNVQSYNNHVSSYGGGIYFLKITSMEMSNVKVFNNYAQSGGGGIFISTMSAITFSNVDIENNGASGNGGGMPLQQLTAPLILSNFTFTNNYVTGNG